MRRGDIWEAQMKGKIGKRPVLILTRSAVIPYLSKVTVAEITTQAKGYPTQVLIGQVGNLPRHSAVSVDNIHTIQKDVLTKYIGELTDSLLKQINESIIFALDLMIESS